MSCKTKIFLNQIDQQTKNGETIISNKCVLPV